MCVPVSRGATVFVWTNSPSDGPGTAWSNAWHSIQAAVDVATNAGDVVLVTNGTYYVSSRIRVTNAISVRSVNGDEETEINGRDASGGFYLDNVACRISGFTVTRMRRSDVGGGIECNGTLPVVARCTIHANRSLRGAGCYGGTLVNCVLSRNQADGNGGGCDGGTLRNCLVWHNQAGSDGGGTVGGIVQGCTVVENSAGNHGGGCYGGAVKSSIVYDNSATVDGANWYNHLGNLSVAHSCTTPRPGGPGNTTNAPLFKAPGMIDFRLLPASPCINAGTNLAWMAGTRDLDEQPRVVGLRVDMGAYEYDPPPFVDITNVNATVPGEIDSCTIAGTNGGWVIGMMRWANSLASAGGSWQVAGDTWTVTNVPLVPGENQISVFASNGAAVWPYTNWLDAATRIQSAVNAANVRDTVLVAPHTYRPGSQVKLDKTIAVRGVEGAVRPVVDGQHTHRVFMIDGRAVLDGFSVVNGQYIAEVGEGSGGGVHCRDGGTVQNCIISNNLAQGADGVLSIRGEPGQGGGVHCSSGIVRNCVIVDNMVVGGSGDSMSSADGGDGLGGGVYCVNGAVVQGCLVARNGARGGDESGGRQDGDGHGGGLYCKGDSAVQNCTVVGNAARGGSSGGEGRGGGVWCQSGATVQSTIVFSNMAFTARANWEGGSYGWCCTVPRPAGAGNTTNAPLFAGAATNNYRLRAASPCIDTGPPGIDIRRDLDGTERPLDGNGDGVAIGDIGAYEFVDSSADSDGDGRLDGDELDMGLDPTRDEDPLLDAIAENPDTFGLYSSNSILDLRLGGLMLATSNGWMRLWLQLERAEDLTGGVWSNAGDAVEWLEPAGEGKAYYRVRGGE